MKILYWVPLFWPEGGGIEVMAMKSLPFLQEHGHQFLVVASHGTMQQPDIMDFNGIPVYRFPFWTALSKNDIGLLRTIREEVIRLKETFEPDLMHIHFSGYTIYFQLVTSHAYPVPMLVTLHTSVAECKTGLDTMLGRLLRAASWVSADSRATLNDACDVIPEIAGRSSVIYNCLDAPRIDPAPLPSDDQRIVCLGRLVREKGFDLVISAFASIAERFPRLSIVIIGDGPERRLLEYQAATLGLTRSVTFTGAIPNERVGELLNTATFVVVPSRYREPFPLVALEAAQMARPVIATNMGGLPESVVDGETGFLVALEDSTALVDAMVFLLEHPKTATKMGLAGRSRVLAHFTMANFVYAYGTLYQRLGMTKHTTPSVYEDDASFDTRG